MELKSTKVQSTMMKKAEGFVYLVLRTVLKIELHKIKV